VHGRRRGTAAHWRSMTMTGERRQAFGAARRRSGRHGFEPWLGRDGGAMGEAVGATAVRARRAGDSGAREADGASEAGCRDARRPVPTAALSHGVCAARRAASDRWGPLVSDFQIKNHPERK
jgi:hypothetical protein